MIQNSGITDINTHTKTKRHQDCVTSAEANKCNVFSVLKKWVHYYNRSVGPSLRLHDNFRRGDRSWWNFLYSLVSWIPQSSLKMRRIHQEMAELSKKLIIDQTIPEEEYREFQKQSFSQLFTTYISRRSFGRWFRIWY